jgi:hypothetical protein
MTPVTAATVRAALSYDQAFTVSEVASLACGRDAWQQRTNVRNRLLALEAEGLAICDENRPARWLRPDLTMPARLNGRR